jgi:hypothetical protein
MSLRELRLWHWQKLCEVRFSQEHANSEARSRLQAIANIHLKAVQCLNDHVPGTAEYDDAKAANGPVSSVQDIPAGACAGTLGFRVDELRAEGISQAGNLAELLSRQAAELEKPIFVNTQAFGHAATLDQLYDRKRRAELARDMASLLFRAAELERGK